jgi:HEPN domain-containing protein
VNRTDLQQLAEQRLEDARVLFQNGRYSAADYLCGYAVECGLKASIAKRVNQYDFPPNATFSRDVYTHDLKELVKHADLAAQRDARMARSPQFKLNWEVVQEWSEKSRYENWTTQQAQELLDAIDQVPHGVMAWIRQHW